LKQTQNVSFTALKITKFMLAIDVYILVVVAISTWVVVGYMVNWDIVGLFIGEYRNVEMDIAFMILISLLSIMSYNSVHFSQVFWGYTFLDMLNLVFRCKKKQEQNEATIVTSSNKAVIEQNEQKTPAADMNV